MNDQFQDVVGRFIAFAEALRSELSEDQIQSAFLYASACYSARYICSDESSAHGSPSEQTASTADAYGSMLQNAVRFYGGGDDA